MVARNSHIPHGLLASPFSDARVGSAVLDREHVFGVFVRQGAQEPVGLRRQQGRRHRNVEVRHEEMSQKYVSYGIFDVRGLTISH